MIMKWSAAIAILVGLVALVGWSRQRPVEKVQQADQSSAREGLTGESERLEESVETLTKAVNSLVTRIGRLEQRQSVPADPPQPSAAETRQKNEGREHPVESRQERIAQAREAAMEQLDVIEDSFRAERREEAWARPMQAKLESTFREGGFEGTQMVGTDCRATFCRMEVTHDGFDSQINFEEIRSKIPGSYHMQKLEPDASGKSRTVAFFIREGREEQNVIRSLMTAQR